MKIIGRTVRLHRYAPRFAQRSVLVLTRNRRGRLTQRYTHPDTTSLRYTPIRCPEINQMLTGENANG